MTQHTAPNAPAEAASAAIDAARLDEASQHCPALRDDLLRLWAEAATRYADALDPKDLHAWTTGLHALVGAAALVGAREVLTEAEAARLACDVLGRSAARTRLRAATVRSARAAWELLGLGGVPGVPGL